MLSLDPSLLRQEGNSLPRIWKLTAQRLAFTYPHLRKKPESMLRMLEDAQKNGAIPEFFEGKKLSVPSLRWVNERLADIRANDKDDEHEKVYFPESFRSQKTTQWEDSYQRVIKEDGAGEWVETSKRVEVTLPPKLSYQMISAAAWVIKIFNEKGFERPTIRLVENFYFIMTGVNADDRDNVAVRYLGLMAAVVLSYGDTTNDPNEENMAWRYIEGWLAYEGYKPTDTIQSQVWYEAMSQREQEIERANQNYPTMPGGLGAHIKEGGIPRRRTKLPDGATMKSFPYPEMVARVKNSRDEFIYMAFQHPAQITDSEEGLQERMEASYEGLRMDNLFTIKLERKG